MRVFFAATVLIGALSVVLSSCSGPVAPFTRISFDRIDITDAQGLVVSSGTGVASAGVRSASTTSLYKVTTAGTLERVDAYADDVLVGSLESLDAVFEVGGDYTVLVFPYGSFLARTSDGAVFDLGVRPSGLGSERFVNRSPVRRDDDGNLYLPLGVAGDTSITAVHMIRNATSNTPQLVRITPDTDNVFAFAVAATGHVAYDGNPQSRVVSPSGALANLPRQPNVWATPNGKLHFSTSVDNRIYQVDESSDGTIVTSLWGEFPSFSPFSLFGFKVELRGRLYWIDRLDTNGQPIVEFFNETATPRVIAGHDLGSIKTAGASTDHLYVAGTDESFAPRLVRWDPTDETFTDVIPAGVLDVYAMSVHSDGSLIVAATRMSDGARIVASVDPAGTLSTLDETSNHEVRDLIRVN